MSRVPEDAPGCPNRGEAKELEREVADEQRHQGDTIPESEDMSDLDNILDAIDEQE